MSGRDRRRGFTLLELNRELAVVELEEQARQIVEQAQPGTQGVEVHLEDVDARTWTGTDADAPTDRRRRVTLSLRILLDEDRQAQSSCVLPSGGKARDRIIGEAIAKVCAAAAKAKAEVNGGLPPKFDVRTRGLGIDDPRQPRLMDEDRAEVIRFNVKTAGEVSPSLRVGPFSLTETLSNRALATSRGISMGERRSHWALEGMVGTLEGADRVLSGSQRSCAFADVASMSLGADLARRVVALEGGSTLGAPTGVVFEPRVLAPLLAHLATAFRAENVQVGRSFLAKLKGPLGSGLVHLVDDASRSGAPSTRGFDGRGVPPTVLNLIKEGEVGDLYQGVAFASAKGARPTGHAHIDGSLWGGALIFRAGNRTRNMIFPDLGPLTVLSELADPAGLAKAVNLRTGAIKLPVWTRVYGQESAGVHTLQCSVAELFGGVIAVTSDHTRHGRVDVPTIVTTGVWFD
jgi:predicted Zn-dependent protease